MEERLEALAAAAKITREQINRLSTVSNIPVETLSNYDQKTFIQLCHKHTDRPVVGQPGGGGATSFSTTGQTELSAGLTAIQVGLTSLAENMEARNIKDKIPIFDGTSKGPDKFHQWSKEIDRQKSIHNLSDSALRKLVSCTVTGSASDYLGRLLTKNPNHTWTELKEFLKDRYANLCSSIVSRSSLQSIKQGPKESVQSLAERIFAASEISYTKEELESPIVTKELLNVFIKALKDDHVARRLIRRPPKSLDTALEIAIQAEIDNYTFDVTRGRATEVKRDF